MVSKICLNCMNKKKHKDDICEKCGVASVKEGSEPWHLTPGTFLNERYLLGRSLSHGDFGVTYIAYDLDLQVKVAIKEYLPIKLATRKPRVKKVSVYEGEKEELYNNGLKVFIDEAGKLTRLAEHKGIVKIQDIFEKYGTAYLVMEYIEGITLENYLSNRMEAFHMDDALTLLMPVIDVLCELHKAEIIHRNICPDNILITQDKKVRLINFGAARYAVTRRSKSLSNILKPGYAPEEQYRSKKDQGPWSDIYAVSAILYRMITGIVPEEALGRVMKDEIKLPSELGIEIQPHIEKVLMKALAIKANDRFQRMEEFRGQITGNIVPELNDRQKYLLNTRKKKKKLKRGLVYITTSITVIIIIITSVYRIQMSQQGKDGVTHSEKDFVIEFEDSNLEAVIRDIINKPSGEIFKDDVINITELRAVSKGIQKLGGLQYLEGLKEIDLSNNAISDISSLSNLENLICLRLGHYTNGNGNSSLNGLSALSNMKYLKVLDLAGYNISDLSSISSLTQLTYLNLYGNNIIDISGIRKLNQLTYLNLNNNYRLYNISELSHLKSLKKLYLDENNISDISPLLDLVRLEEVTLFDNNISDISSLRKMKQLKYLGLYNNQNIQDYSSLKNLISLKKLEIDGDYDYDDFEVIAN